MTREDLENLVIEATGRSDKLTLIRSAINLALDEVSSQHSWLDLAVEASATIIGGDTSVDLGSNVTRVSEIRVIDGTLSRPLLVRPKSWLIAKCPSPESRSPARPVYGYLQGSTLYLLPRPEKNYEIRFTYYRMHPALTNPTDQVLLTACASVVVAWATFWVFQSIEKLPEAKQWHDVYALQLKSAIKIDRENTVTKYEAEGRSNYDDQVSRTDYWLDPFVRSMP